MSSLALLPPGYLPSGWLSQMITAVRLRQIGGAIGFTALLLTLLPPSTRNLTRPPDTSQSLPHECRRDRDGRPHTWTNTRSLQSPPWTLRG